MATDSTGNEIKWEKIKLCLSNPNLYQTVKYVIRYTPDSSGLAAIYYLNNIIRENGNYPYKDELLKWTQDPKLSSATIIDSYLGKLNELQRQYNLYQARKEKASPRAPQNQTSQKNNSDKTASANVTPIQTGPENKEKDKAMQPNVESKNEKPQEKRTSALYDVNPQSMNPDENKSNDLPPSTKPPEISLQNTGDVKKPPIQSKYVEPSSANDSSKTPVLPVQTAAKIDERKAKKDNVAPAKPTQENTRGSDLAEKNPVKPPNKDVPIIAKPNIPGVYKLQEAQAEKNVAKFIEVKSDISLLPINKNLQTQDNNFVKTNNINEANPSIPGVKEQPQIAQVENNSVKVPIKTEPSSTIAGVNKLQEAQTEKNLVKPSNKDVSIFASLLTKLNPNLKIAQAEKTVPNNAAPPGGRTKKEYNILLFGETGVGKSTFINGFHNYITYKTFKKALKKGPKVTVPFQLEINGQLHTFGNNTQGNEDFNQSAQSVTQNSKCYTVEEGDVCYNFIDTPGLSDTRGIEYDRKNSDETMEFLKTFEKEIHAICVLFKADKSKLTPEFTNILGNLFKIHKNVANNIFFWFTHCQNGYGASLNTVREWLKQSEAKFTIDGQNCFQIQNNCINQLWSQKINPDDLSAKGNFPEITQAFWKDNIKEIEKFKGILQRKQAISLKETIELFQLEKDYQIAAGDAVDAISICADKFDNDVKNFVIAEKYLAQSFIMYNRSCLYDQIATYAPAKDKQSAALQFYKIMYDMFCNEKKLKSSNNIEIGEINAAIDYLKNKENMQCSTV